MKIGPELFVKLSILSHSSLEHMLFSLKLEAIFAPTGYPLIIPIINAKAPSPLMLKIGFINLLNTVPNFETIFVCISNSVATKKGKREGTTELAHKAKPDFIAGKLLLENISRKNVKPKKSNGRKFLFNFIT